jgi:hypothetical protein
MLINERFKRPNEGRNKIKFSRNGLISPPRRQISELKPLNFANFFAGFGLKGKVFGYSGNDKKWDLLLFDFHFNDAFGVYLAIEIVSGFFCNLARSTLMRGFILVYLPFRETPSRRRLPALHKNHLIPGVIEHDRTTDRDSGLVPHKMVKCAVMITTPALEEGTCLEEHLGELFQG